jgi:hypothetical protein
MARSDLHVIADLLGLPHPAVAGVERRANGDYAILIRRPRPGSMAVQLMPRWTWSRRVLRIPERRVHGYRQRSPRVTPRDLRARRKANAKRFAWWLRWIDLDMPVARRALLENDLDAVDELRTAILAAAPPEDDEPVAVVRFGFNGNGRRAA